MWVLNSSSPKNFSRLFNLLSIEGVIIFYFPIVISFIFLLNDCILLSIFEFISFSLNSVLNFLGYVYWSIINEKPFYIVSNYGTENEISKIIDKFRCDDNF